jgi:hypothetical protein
VVDVALIGSDWLGLPAKAHRGAARFAAASATSRAVADVADVELPTAGLGWR